MSQQLKQEPAGDENDDISSIADSEWSVDTSVTIGGNYGNKVKELKLKMVALKSKNQVLEGRLENQELKAKLRDKSLERVKMANNELTRKVAQFEQEKKYNCDTLENTISIYQQKVDELEKEMACLKKDQLKEPQPPVKSTRVDNPLTNHWKGSNTDATISTDGLLVKNETDNRLNIYADKGFAISGENCRMDQFAGKIIYYYEVTKKTSSSETTLVGLSDGTIPDGSVVGHSPYSYAMQIENYFDMNEKAWKENNCVFICGMCYKVELSSYGNNKPISSAYGVDVYGCGIMLGSTNKLTIFFTFNGILAGKKVLNKPSVDYLYPTVCMGKGVSVEANFGNNSANPFIYDIDECAGLV